MKVRCVAHGRGKSRENCVIDLGRRGWDGGSTVLCLHLLWESRWRKVLSTDLYSVEKDSIEIYMCSQRKVS